METLEIPTVIESRSEYESALHTVSELARKSPHRTREEDKLLRTWVLLIEDYESRTRERKLRKFSPQELLSFLMDENGLNQRSFEPGIAQSRMSDILSGKRAISSPQAIVFGERFRVRPALFLGLE